ncbi:MAG: FABP family protein, partial [Mycobacteriaceae bacterium]|nr:FABP family protein [Mycobacteriaceae bacterium]
ARAARLDEAGAYRKLGLRETGFWRFVTDADDPSESQAIELLLAHSAGYVELFYGQPRTQSSWELATDALARSRSGPLVGGAKRLYGIVEDGDLAYVEERVDADGGLVPHLSARLARFAG